MKKILAGVAATLFGVILAGCQMYWTKPNATLEEFTTDHQACVRELGMPAAPNSSLVTVQPELFKRCLKARGWERVQDGTTATQPGRFRSVEGDDVVAVDSVPAQVQWLPDMRR
jgi:hypothetical protein